MTLGAVREGTYSQPVSGSTAAPCQLAPPPAPSMMMVPLFAVAFCRDRFEDWPVHEFVHEFDRLSPQFRP